MSEQAGTHETDLEAERVESLDARFGKIEAEQAAQGGKLDQILSRLGSAAAPEGKAHAAAQAHTEDRLDAGSSIADQVRAAVQAVGAEQAQKAAADQHERDHQALREMREKPPRETTQGWRGKLQRAMYGGDPQ
jgi:hypothetical protein